MTGALRLMCQSLLADTLRPVPEYVHTVARTDYREDCKVRGHCVMNSPDK